MISRGADDPYLSDSDSELPPDPRSTEEVQAMNMRTIAMTKELLEQIGMECKTVNKSLKSLKECIKTNLLCPLCRKYYKNPYSLECGHSFCLGCLQKYLENVRTVFLDWKPGYYDIPKHYIDALRRPLLNPDLHLEAVQWITDNPGPRFDCPFCEKTLSKSPIKDYHLKEMVEAFKECSGVVHVPDDREGTEKDKIFDKFLLL